MAEMPRVYEGAIGFGFATRVVVRSRDAGKLAAAKTDVEAMTERIRASLAAKRNAN